MGENLCRGLRSLQFYRWCWAPGRPLQSFKSPGSWGQRKSRGIVERDLSYSRRFAGPSSKTVGELPTSHSSSTSCPWPRPPGTDSLAFCGPREGFLGTAILEHYCGLLRNPWNWKPPAPFVTAIAHKYHQGGFPTEFFATTQMFHFPLFASPSQSLNCQSSSKHRLLSPQDPTALALTSPPCWEAGVGRIWSARPGNKVC